MNRDRAKELLPIIQAFAEGKIVQYKSHGADWNGTCDTLLLEFADHIDYRIKPEPEVIWVNGYKAGARHGFPSKREALDQLNRDTVMCHTIFVAKKFIAAE